MIQLISSDLGLTVGSVNVTFEDLEIDLPLTCNIYPQRHYLTYSKIFIFKGPFQVIFIQ